MKSVQSIPSKIYSLPALEQEITRWRMKNKRIVFTNGVFDILHEGHIASLSQAATYADVLIVGVNSDASVKRLKGDSRPVNNEHSRALVLASLVMTDAIIFFEEDTPLNLITAIMPDVLVKGGDYAMEQIAGSKEVLENGGRVVINPIQDGFSSTGILAQIKSSFS